MVQEEAVAVLVNVGAQVAAAQRAGAETGVLVKVGTQLAAAQGAVAAQLAAAQGLVKGGAQLKAKVIDARIA